MNTFTKQANDFLKATKTTFKAEFIKNDYYFEGDNSTRDIYKCTFKRGNRQFSVEFGQSIANSDYGNTPPTAYDVLTCLEKYEYQNFEDFCSAYGYDSDSRSAEKIYKACAKEFTKVYKDGSEEGDFEWEEIDSCWGFFGDHETSGILEHIPQEFHEDIGNIEIEY